MWGSSHGPHSCGPVQDGTAAGTLLLEEVVVEDATQGRRGGSHSLPTQGTPICWRGQSTAAGQKNVWSRAQGGVGLMREQQGAALLLVLAVMVVVVTAASRALAA